MEYLQTMPFYYKLLAVSVCVLVVAVVLYFVPGGRIRIPAIVFCGFACFLAGIAVGVIGMYGFGFHWEHEPTPPIARSPFGGGGPPDGGGSKKGGEGTAKKGDDKKGDGKKENGKKSGSADAKKDSEKKSKVDDF